jgi:Family of unknown function (DUF6226)
MVLRAGPTGSRSTGLPAHHGRPLRHDTGWIESRCLWTTTIRAQWEAYSRLSDPGKWRIFGARADAWILALVDAGLAVVERDASIRWRVQPGTVISRTERIVPFAAGALPLVVARSRLGDGDDAGVTLGVGDPAVCVTWFPVCGCDACDSGSQDELDRLDDHIHSVVSGAFRRLSTRDREITLISDDARSAPGEFGRREVDAILTDPTGWDEVAGTSWLRTSQTAQG